MMDRYDFFTELEERLSGLPKEDIDKALEFYGEMIDERMDDGCSEEQAVAAIGTPKQIAESVWKEMSFFKVVKASVKNTLQKKKKENQEKSHNKTATVLLWAGSPIWGSLLIALIATAFAVVVSVYASLWAVVVSLWAGFVCVSAGALGGLLGLVLLLMQGNIGGGLFLFGSAIALAGLMAFFYYGCIYTTKGMCIVSKKLWIWTKMLFVKKEKVQ